MPSLADQPEVIGFFSYSRDDDEDSEGALTTLRRRIQNELRAQLGRTGNTLRLWQDSEAIPPGTLWHSQIEGAIEQSVFFVPIITPRVLNSRFCDVEFRRFLAREQQLQRADLVFPIIYIEVDALRDDARVADNPVLQIIADRQYVDWSEFRHELDGIRVRQLITAFCRNIAAALRRQIPAERPRESAAPAVQRETEPIVSPVAEPAAEARESTAPVAVETAEHARPAEVGPFPDHGPVPERETVAAAATAPEPRLPEALVHEEEPEPAAAPQPRHPSPTRAAIEWGAIGAVSSLVGWVVSATIVAMGSRSWLMFALLDGLILGTAASLALARGHLTAARACAGGAVIGGIRLFLALVFTGIASAIPEIVHSPALLVLVQTPLGSLAYGGFAIFEPPSRRKSVWLTVVLLVVVGSCILAALYSADTDQLATNRIIGQFIGIIYRGLLFAIIGHAVAKYSR